MNKRTQGTLGENLAVDYLQKKGYRILQQNFRYERGEIDIVADNHGVLVFVEVKARRSRLFGEPEEAVTPRKRNQLRKTADGYLLVHDIDDRECRFDVIAIEYEKNQPILRHLVDAF